MIFIDEPKYHTGRGWFSHMSGTTVKELREFANSVGVPPFWFSNPKGKYQPHYDVQRKHFAACVKAGAKICNTRYLLEFMTDSHKPKTNQNGR